MKHLSQTWKEHLGSSFVGSSSREFHITNSCKISEEMFFILLAEFAQLLLNLVNAQFAHRVSLLFTSQNFCSPRFALKASIRLSRDDEIILTLK